jgi:hypothetical protein
MLVSFPASNYLAGECGDRIQQAQPKVENASQTTLDSIELVPTASTASCWLSMMIVRQAYLFAHSRGKFNRWTSS